jgi:hypothetical protein
MSDTVVQKDESQRAQQQFADTAKASETVKKMEPADIQTPQNQQFQEQIKVPEEVAYTLKLQQFDKEIATAETKIAELKQQKAEYIFQRNLDIVIKQSKEQMIKQQVEEEAKKKIQEMSK